MAITYHDIRSERQWKASTGLTEEKFFALSKEFGQAYEQIFGLSIDERQKNSTAEATFRTYEDLLFFTLYSIKSGLTYDLLGLSFDLSSSNAHKNQALGLRILCSALSQAGHMPKRFYQNVEEFKEHWLNESEVLIDVTEQKRQRPGNQADQREDYSGKKKPIL